MSGRPQVYQRIKKILSSAVPSTTPLPEPRIQAAKELLLNKPLPKPVLYKKQTNPQFNHPYRAFIKRLKADGGPKIVKFNQNVVHVEYTRFITLCDQVKGLALSDAIQALKFHRKPITRKFSPVLYNALVKAKDSGLDLSKTFIADVYVKQNAAYFSDLFKKRYLRGRARYGSSPHAKTCLLRFTLQERDGPFKVRAGDPLEWIRERMRANVFGPSEGIAERVYKRVKRESKVVYN